MSEFMDRHTVARLVGAPPGYVGYSEGGQLTEAVRRKSYSVILLDEIEKAHPEVFNILLQIFDDGHLTDAKGRKVDFRNTVIVMTSNIGSDLIRQDRSIGFSARGARGASEEQAYARMKDNVLEEVKRFFRPEFLNRIDGTVVFHALSRENMREIVKLQLQDVSGELIEQGLTMEVSDAARDWLSEKGYDPQFGARPMRRLIQDHLEDTLSDAILAGEVAPGDVVLIDINEDADGLSVRAKDKVKIKEEIEEAVPVA